MTFKHSCCEVRVFSPGLVVREGERECVCVPGRAVVQLHRKRGSDAPSPNHDLVVDLTSAQVAGAAAGGAGEIRYSGDCDCKLQLQLRGVQTQEMRVLRLSRGKRLNNSKKVAKGPHAFQEQNCHGCQREMSSPIVFPPVATLKSAPDLGPKRRSFADRAHRPEPPRCRTTVVDALYRHSRHDHPRANLNLSGFHFISCNTCQAPDSIQSAVSVATVSLTPGAGKR